MPGPTIALLVLPLCCLDLELMKQEGIHPLTTLSHAGAHII